MGKFKNIFHKVVSKFALNKELGLNRDIILKSQAELFHQIELHKSFLYQKEKDPSKPSILILTQLSYTGGVEARIYKFIQEVKKYVNIFLISARELSFNREVLNIPEVFHYQAYSFFGYKESVSAFIREIIIRHDIKVIEFNISCQFDIDYEMLSYIPQLRKVLLFHGNYLKQIAEYGEGIYSNLIPYMDLLCSAHPTDEETGMKIIPNAVYLQKKLYCYPEKEFQQNILLISRLDEDKLMSIKNALIFAEKHSLRVTIAGSARNVAIANSTQAFIQENFPDVEVQYVGKVSTQEYLKQHYNKYLFVLGVGQVPLEAASVGFPVAIASTKPNAELIFVKRSNIKDCAYRNFVSCDNYTTSQEKDFQKILNKDLKDFDVWDLINRDFNIKDRVEFYFHNCLFPNYEKIKLP